MRWTMASSDPIPAQITQGTTLSATVACGDYPATTYTGACVFYDGASRITATVVASGLDYLVSLTATQTASMRCGAWTWQAFASLGAERVELDKGLVVIAPDLVQNQTPPYDARSPARKMLAQYNELLTNAAFIKTIPPDQIAELERVRKQAEWDVKREDDAAKLKAGGYPTRKILTRFA